MISISVALRKTEGTLVIGSKTFFLTYADKQEVKQIVKDYSYTIKKTCKLTKKELNFILNWIENMNIQ